MEARIASYNDFQGLANLRTQAQKDASSAIEEVGQQFESYFTRMMLKSMRDASEVLRSDLFSSDQSKTYEQMFDEELSTEMAKKGPLGVGEWMRQAVENNMGGPRANSRSIAAYQSDSVTRLDSTAAMRLR
jgi:flagellar protein FlgJ